MAHLVYSVIASVDGYVADADGSFDWATPGEDVHRAVNELEARIGTYLYGRRMYEVMSVWQDIPGPEGASEVEEDFAALWKAADKIVYSATLASVGTARTRLERSFDVGRVRALVSELSQDVSIGGPTLASVALRAGIVDDVHLFVVPAIVGGGVSCWPPGVRLELELRDEHRFADGTVHLHYRVRRGTAPATRPVETRHADG